MNIEQKHKKLKERVLEQFSTWSPEKQLSEYLAYRGMGSFSPFSEKDLEAMQLILENSSVDFISEDYSDLNDDVPPNDLSDIDSDESVGTSEIDDSPSNDLNDIDSDEGDIPNETSDDESSNLSDSKQERLEMVFDNFLIRNDKDNLSNVDNLDEQDFIRFLNSLKCKDENKELLFVTNSTVVKKEFSGHKNVFSFFKKTYGDNIRLTSVLGKHLISNETDEKNETGDLITTKELTPESITSSPFFLLMYFASVNEKDQTFTKVSGKIFNVSENDEAQKFFHNNKLKNFFTFVRNYADSTQIRNNSAMSHNELKLKLFGEDGIRKKKQEKISELKQSVKNMVGSDNKSSDKELDLSAVKIALMDFNNARLNAKPPKNTKEMNDAYDASLEVLGNTKFSITDSYGVENKTFNSTKTFEALETASKETSSRSKNVLSTDKGLILNKKLLDVNAELQKLSLEFGDATPILDSLVDLRPGSDLNAIKKSVKHYLDYTTDESKDDEAQKKIIKKENGKILTSHFDGIKDVLEDEEHIEKARLVRSEIKGLTKHYESLLSDLKARIKNEELNGKNPAVKASLDMELKNFNSRMHNDISSTEKKLSVLLSIPNKDKRLKTLEKLYPKRDKKFEFNELFLQKLDEAFSASWATYTDINTMSNKINRGNILQEIKNGWEVLKKIERNKGFNLPGLSLKLYNYRMTGEGKGERLIEFLFPATIVSGGSLSFDISLNGRKYEVKAYPQNNLIKLGKEGRATNFKKLVDLQKLFENLSIIYSDPKNSFVLQAMAEDSNSSVVHDQFLKLEELLTSPIKGSDSRRTISEAFAMGEISTQGIEAISEAVDCFKKMIDGIKKNNFYYMKIFNKKNNAIYRIKNGNDIDLDATEVSFDGFKMSINDKKITERNENAVISALISILENSDLISSRNSSKYINGVWKSINSALNKSFRSHPMILLNNSSASDTDSENNADTKVLESIAYVDKVLTKFELRAITRGNAAVLPVDISTTNEKNNETEASV